MNSRPFMLASVANIGEPLWLYSANVVDDALDAFSEEGTTGGEVDTDVALAGGFAIHGACVDKDFGLAKQVVGDLPGGLACGLGGHP